MTALAMVVGGASVAEAATISNPGPATGALQPFGPGGTQIYGQTITAPADANALTAFSFQITASASMVVRGEVYAWDGTKATGSALFESAPVTIAGDSATHTVSFPGADAALTRGNQYVLFATVLKDTQPNAGATSQWPSTGDTVAGGSLVFLNTTSFDGATSNTWSVRTTQDAMFTAEYTELAPTLSAVTPTSGDVAGGSTVAISGQYLSGVTAVTIGGAAAADVQVVSDTEITATVPAGQAGAADIAVTTPGGTATLTGAYTYVAHVPSAPQQLQVVANDGQADLSWAAPADDGGAPVSSYVVQQRAAGEEAWTTAATVPGTTATVTGLSNGSQYAFRVAAVNDAGTGAFTDAVTATPAGVPAAPTDVTAVATDRTVALQWAAPAETGGSAITSYTVQQSTGTDWNTVATTTDTSTTLTDLTNGTAYSFRVIAANAVGASAASTATTATPYLFAPTLTVNDQPLTEDATVKVGDAIAAAQGQLPASATVTVTLHSTPVVLASAEVEADGSVTAQGNIPTGVAAGAHELVATLTLADGTTGGEVIVPVTLAASATAPTATPTPTPTPTPTDNGTGTGTSAATPPTVKALAFTGSEGLTSAGAIAALLLMLGSIVALVGRRRRRNNG